MRWKKISEKKLGVEKSWIIWLDLMRKERIS